MKRKARGLSTPTAADTVATTCRRYRRSRWLVFALLLGGALPSTASAEVTTFSNPAPIAIPGSGTEGPATPYPSAISVSGRCGIVTKATVTVPSLTHSNPDDLDMLLVGPGGQRALLMSDVGGTNAVVFAALTFDDAAAGSLPDETQITPGTYKPTNGVGGPADVFPGPAPTGPYDASLAAFNGTAPNGTWQLYVTDDLFDDTGSLAGGWSLTLDTPDCPPTPAQPAAPPAVRTVSRSRQFGRTKVTLTSTLPASSCVPESARILMRVRYKRVRKPVGHRGRTFKVTRAFFGFDLATSAVDRKKPFRRFVAVKRLRKGKRHLISARAHLKPVRGRSKGRRLKPFIGGPWFRVCG